jgi:hypothetical protein
MKRKVKPSSQSLKPSKKARRGKGLLLDSRKKAVPSTNFIGAHVEVEYEEEMVSKI